MNKKDNRQNVIPYKDNRYSKSNYLISAKYSSSLLENKIMAISLAKIQKKEYMEDKNGRIICSMSAGELREMIQANAGSFYTQLEPVAMNMAARTIGFSDPDKNGGMFDYISVIDRAKYENGVFTIFYNVDVKEYLSDFKANFTILELPTMLKFKNVYSFRLYELLSSRLYYKKGIPKEQRNCIFKIDFNLSELKLDMGVVNAELDDVRKELNNKKSPDFDKAVRKSPEKKFNTWYDFKRYVLDTAVKEINLRTDMKISYVPLKSGRGARVYGVEFMVDLTERDVKTAKKCFEPVLSEDEKLDVLVEAKLLLKEFSTKDIRIICEKSGYNVERIRKAYELLCRQSSVGNAAGWMIACLKDGYEDNKWNGQEKKNHNNMHFHQRDYDYAELEAKLLNGNL